MSEFIQNLFVIIGWGVLVWLSISLTAISYFIIAIGESNGKERILTISFSIFLWWLVFISCPLTVEMGVN